MRGTKLEVYYNLVGRIISNWAVVEARLASAIWRIGEIPDEIGASITSQIYTFDGKVKALQSILRVRGYEHEAAKLGTVTKAGKGLSEARNRIVHDPVKFEGGDVLRLEITADRHLKFGYQKIDLDVLHKMVTDIDDLDNKIEAAIKPALDAIPRLPLPNKPH